jgi:hypothetical protein
MMNQSLQSLKHVLQILALPVTAQLRLAVREGSCPEMLAQDYRYWQQQVLNAAIPLTWEQEHLLAELGQKLQQLSPDLSHSAWSDSALRLSPDWRQVRQMARRVLVGFHWTLNLPPLGEDSRLGPDPAPDKYLEDLEPSQTWFPS